MIPFYYFLVILNICSSTTDHSVTENNSISAEKKICDCNRNVNRRDPIVWTHNAATVKLAANFLLVKQEAYCPQAKDVALQVLHHFAGVTIDTPTRNHVGCKLHNKY